MNAPLTQNKLGKAAGISTFEVVIVVAMVSILIGFACLQLAQANRTTYRQSTAVDFANCLQKARLDSIRRQVSDVSQMAQVKVFNRKSYSIAVDADMDGQLDIPLVMNLPTEQGIEMNGPFPKTFIFDGQGQTVDSLNHRVSPDQIILSNASGASAVRFSDSGEVIVTPASKQTATK
jgi:Tfp pilus assembly protein FimT